MLQVYVVTIPAIEAAGVVVHDVIPAVPLIVQVIVPVGARAPTVPVTVVVKVKVLFIAPEPLPLIAIAGDTFAMVTVTGVVAERAV
jgi:hypothetical protein